MSYTTNDIGCEDTIKAIKELLIMRRITIISLVFTAILSGIVAGSRSAYNARDESLRSLFGKIAMDARGQVGISLFHLEKGERLSVAGDRHFAMQSVFKIPLAMYILDAIDRGRLSLDQKVHIGKADWVEKTWSPMRDQYKSQETDISLQELLTFSVSVSDNIACDVLFRLADGIQPVGAYVHGLGIRDMMIGATEAQMHTTWDVQYQNWCTPDAMAMLFKLLYEGRHLSAASTSLLLKLMTESASGPGRIKGLLPPGTPVAHKTGTSDTNNEGITAATNDAGIITLPDGNHLILIVFVGDAKSEESTRESVIARIAKVAFDHYARTGSQCAYFIK